MKKVFAIVAALLLAAGTAGCGLELREEDIYRQDTVIYIPAEPTTAATEPPVETELTEPSTEAETTEEKVPETTKASSGKKSSGSRKTTSSSSSSSSSGKPSSSPATEPATEATEESAAVATTEPETEPVTEAATVPPTEETEASTEATETEETTTPPETEPPLYDISGYTVGSLEKAMMNEINRLRSEEGLAELSKSSRLCAIASARAYEASLSWSHTRPDGTSYTTVFQDYGYGCGASAENLIYTSGGEDGAALVARWMDAEGNRNNLMGSGFSTVGIGIYQADGYVFIACLLAG